VDVEVALHLIAGPLYLRAVFPEERLDATYPERSPMPLCEPSAPTTAQSGRRLSFWQAQRL
jgi:hypothetical protein